MHPPEPHPPVQFGLPGVEVLPGDHVCAFYPTKSERDEILLPYLTAGLEAGHKCLGLLDREDAIETAVRLGVPPGAEAGPGGQLDLKGAVEAYIEEGEFSYDALDRFVAGAVEQALAEGYGFARIAVDLTWAIAEPPGAEAHMAHEAKLTPYLPSSPRVLLCLYGLGRVNGEFLLAVLKTHPKVLFGGILMTNPYYLEPEEFLAGRQS